MENVFDFIRAAAPWVAMGLLLAIFAVRSAAKKKKGHEQDGDYGTEGMCLGMCFGTAIGTSLGNNTGLGISARSGDWQLYQKGERKQRREVKDYFELQAETQ